ncbi:MAG TPA: A24 family peptidase C-terminal domain-containing protein [Candidatus Thermoplasmatota archaeon]|nr:A24 family peptidase C-terminal domain-containing protein [Candidatus Thermoplasmatota archaeon]
MLATDAVRLFAGTAILAFATWTDLRWRRAPNVLWIVMASVGAVLLTVDLVSDPSLVSAAPYLAFAPLFAGFILVLYRLHLIAGGADAKALVAAAVLVPFPLHLSGSLPLLESPTPASFATLGNALLAFLALPLVFFVRNLARGDLRFPHAFLGYRMEVDAAKRAHVWPMEAVVDGKLAAVRMPSRFEWEDEDYEALRQAGVERPWVTPKVPFMVPLLAGFVLAFFVGDVLFSLLFRALRG